MHTKLTDCNLDSRYSSIKVLKSKLLSPYEEVVLMKRLATKSLGTRETRNVIVVEVNKLCYLRNMHGNGTALKAYLDDFVMPLDSIWEGGSLENKVTINIAPLDICVLLKELGRDRTVKVLSVLVMS